MARLTRLTQFRQPRDVGVFVYRSLAGGGGHGEGRALLDPTPRQGTCYPILLQQRMDMQGGLLVTRWRHGRCLKVNHDSE